MKGLTRRALIVTAAGLPMAAVAQTNPPAAPAPAPPQAPASGPTPAPADALLYIIWPHDGQRIKGAFWCRFGLRNMGVTRAGDSAPNVGHHHLLIDAKEPVDPGEPIPQDKNHQHFGAGQTEARVDLPPGPHTLQLVLGDAKHRPFSPMVASRKIKITVY